MYKCSKCDYCINTKIILKLHYYLIHEKINYDHCFNCKLSYDSQLSLINYILMLYKNRSENLKYKFMDKKISHIGDSSLNENVDVSNLFKYCKMEVKDEDILSYDVSSDYGIDESSSNCLEKKDIEKKVYKCKVCNLKCKSQSGLTNHIKAIHKIQKVDVSNDYGIDLDKNGTSKKISNESSINYLEEDIEKNIYKCKVCRLQCKSQSGLTYHIKAIHKRKKNYKCPNCDFTCKTKTIYYTHLKENHSRFMCPQCDQNYYRKNNLLQHIKRVHKSFKCTNCEMEFKKDIHLNLHREECKKELSENGQFTKAENGQFTKAENHIFSDVKNLYQCHLCNLQCKNENGLTNHLRVTHLIKKYENLQCQLCGFQFKNRSGYNRHIKAVHANLRPFQCVECAKRFKEKYQLVSHTIVVHDRIKRFKCSECDKEYSKKNNLTLHIASVHSNKCFKCTDCNEEFNKKIDLKRHSKDMHKNKQFKCSKCSAQFGRKDALNRHSDLVHEKQRNFKCAICNHSFATKYGVNSHIKQTHEKIRPYECSYCQRTFPQKNSLQRHIFNSHETDKQKLFKCGMCDYENNRKEALVSHIKFTHSLYLLNSWNKNKSDELN